MKHNLLKDGAALKKMAENFKNLVKAGELDNLRYQDGNSFWGYSTKWKTTYSGATISYAMLDDLFSDIRDIFEDCDNYAKKCANARDCIRDFVEVLRNEADDCYDQMRNEAKTAVEEFIEENKDELNFNRDELYFEQTLDDLIKEEEFTAKEDDRPVNEYYIKNISEQYKDENKKVYCDYRDPDNCDYWLEDFDFSYEKETWEQDEEALYLLFDSGIFDFETGEIDL